jgi:hypothetical protein
MAAPYLRLNQNEKPFFSLQPESMAKQCVRGATDIHYCSMVL